MQTFKQIEPKLESAGFELYLSGKALGNPDIEHEIFTCKKGKYSGEVIDLFYNYYTGEIVRIEYSTQFADQMPTFSL